MLRLLKFLMHIRSFFYLGIKSGKETTVYMTFHSIPLRWISDVNSYPALDAQIALGPTFTYEYNTRQTYGGTITEWGPNDPLNATWWHRVTEGEDLHFWSLFASAHIVIDSMRPNL